MTLASRIGVMNQGEIVQVGTPSEIYEFPNSRFVADFIGSVNLFEGRLIEDEPDHVRVESSELGGRIFVDHGVSTPPDARVWVAVRPEKITLSRTPPPAVSGVPQGDNGAAGTVKEIAYMGDLSIYLVQLTGGKMVRVTQPNTLRHAEDRITWDERVYVHWHPSSGIVVAD